MKCICVQSFIQEYRNGNREQIENGIDGILCSLNPEAIADSIKELIADPKKREKYAKRAQNRNTQNKDELDLLLNMINQGDKRHGRKRSAGDYSCLQ